MSLSNKPKRKKYPLSPEARERRRASNRRYHAAHKAEINERKRRRWANDPEYRARNKATSTRSSRARRLKRFGMSLLEYELRLARQNGACAICKKIPTRRLLCIDHCHKTGKVRGLLCTPCNAALGVLGDHPERMQAATDYLTAFYDSLKPRGDVMTSTDEHAEAGKAGRLMRKAILFELQRERGQPDESATDMLRLIARQLVGKAAEGDIQAIKEVLDRIDGKTVPQAGDAEQGPRQVIIRWKDAPSSS
jgi:Recombination endonuclease VII